MMSDLIFLKTGKAAEKEPAYVPAARGLLFVLEDNPKKGELNTDEYMQINLHAQKELCKLSPEFEKAQKHWTTLPKNQDRQLGGFFINVPNLNRDTSGEDWVHQEFDDYDGLVYAFGITREIDFRTGETWEPIPVVGFSMFGGIETLDDVGKEHRIRYQAFYIFVEK